MKKIIYSILFAATTLLTTTSCSDDDDNNSDCLICDSGSACDNGDGTVTISIDGEEDVVLDLQEDLGFENFAELEAEGCDEDEDEMTTSECVTCAEYTFQGTTFPASEVCELENGNAEVLGQDTNFPFETFLSTQRVVTTCE